MNYSEAQQKLSALKQTQLLRYWDTLSRSDQQKLLSQIGQLDKTLFDFQQRSMTQKTTQQTDYEILKNHSTGNPQLHAAGFDAIKQGKVGCLIVAGGHGTRLGFDKPKGMYPISMIKHKTLFQLFAEKTAAASIQSNRPLLLAIMTSQEHFELVHTYFHDNHYFGLQPSQLSIFRQSSLPLLNEAGNLFLDSPSHIAEGPDGNGSSLHCFIKSGIGQRWKDQGIEHLEFVQVDNPLAKPFDPELIGLQLLNQSDVTMQCILREDPDEKVGIVVEKNNKVVIVEYNEISAAESHARMPKGGLKHPCANISRFCFRMDFIETIDYQNLPFHLAHKAVPYLDGQGQVKHAAHPNAWKFERFIFDILPYSKRTGVLVSRREDCFEPLKNATGAFSPETVRAALQKYDKKLFENITGLPAPLHPFELSQEFHYPTPGLEHQWESKIHLS